MAFKRENTQLVLLYSFRQFETGENLYGFGLGYAYDTIVGPFKAIVHWSTMTRKVGAYLSLGFDF